MIWQKRIQKNSLPDPVFVLITFNVVIMIQLQFNSFISSAILEGRSGRKTLVILHVTLNLPVCCLQVVQADIFTADSLKPHFQGQDVIMSCLGFPASFFSGVTGYSLSMRAVVSAMRTARVSRLVTMTSWYTERKHVVNFTGICWPARWLYPFLDFSH